MKDLNTGNMFGRGMSFPPRIGPDGRFLWSEGIENIQEAIRVILMTELQERLMVPGFGAGLRVHLFEPNTITTHRLIEGEVRGALERWEPRIEINAVNVIPDRDDPEAAILEIDFNLIATGAKESANFSIQLNG